MPRIMIVEDEAIFVMSLERALKKSGYHVCKPAFSGEEALQNVKGENPDLIVLDLCLSFGITGIQVARQIRSSSSTPIVFISGFQREEVQKEIKSIERSFFLTKPFDPDELIGAIEIALGQRCDNPA